MDRIYFAYINTQFFKNFAVFIKFRNFNYIYRISSTIFSFFTILTNTLVAGYFSCIAYNEFKKNQTKSQNLNSLTAITVYITIVGLVYQILLRNTWSPTGSQKVVDELLHSVNPLLVIGYWYFNSKQKTLNYNKIWQWLIYPLVYLVYVIVRGHFSNFYPYPFLNVPVIGYPKMIINSVGITFLFILVSVFFIWITRLRTNKETS